MINHESIYHIVPVNDLKDHTEKCVLPLEGKPYCECDCKPKYEEENESLLVIHNSFDGRENFEYPATVRNN